jgi:hypothetical protein
MALLKSNQLETFALDYAVAMCEKFLGIGRPKPHLGKEEIYVIGDDLPFRPSSNIFQGYDIIMTQGIGTSKFGDLWVADNNTSWKGETPLIAAMRCYVEKTLGSEVEIPNEI